MTITNKSGKIVNIGKIAIMPGETYTPEDKDVTGFVENSVIALLVRQGIIAVNSKKSTAAKKTAEEEARKKAEEEAAAKGATGSDSK